MIIFSAFFSCYDDFDSTIKDENKASETENGNNGGGSGDEWEKITNIATVRAGAAATIYSNTIYIYGGVDYNVDIEKNNIPINDFWRYDIATDSNTQLTSNGAIAYTDMVELDGTLYIFGGKNVDGESTRNLKRYIIPTNNLDERAGPSGFNGDTPSARYSHVSLAYKNPSNGHRLIFVHGGFEDSGDADGALYRLDLDDVNPSGKPRWTKLNFGVVMGAHSGYIYNDKIYFFGGYVSATNTYKNELYVYDIAGDSYDTITPSTTITARSSIKSIATADGIFIYGGENPSGCLDDLWFYSFGNNSWQNISTGPDKRSHYNAMYHSGDLLIYGGYDKNKSGNKVFYSELWQYPINN